MQPSHQNKTSQRAEISAKPQEDWNFAFSYISVLVVTNSAADDPLSLGIYLSVIQFSLIVQISVFYEHLVLKV